MFSPRTTRMSMSRATNRDHIGATGSPWASAAGTIETIRTGAGPGSSTGMAPGGSLSPGKRPGGTGAPGGRGMAPGGSTVPGGSWTPGGSTVPGGSWTVGGQPGGVPGGASTTVDGGDSGADGDG